MEIQCVLFPENFNKLSLKKSFGYNSYVFIVSYFDVPVVVNVG